MQLSFAKLLCEGRPNQIQRDVSLQMGNNQCLLEHGVALHVIQCLFRKQTIVLVVQRA